MNNMIGLIMPLDIRMSHFSSVVNWKERKESNVEDKSRTIDEKKLDSMIDEEFPACDDTLKRTIKTTLTCLLSCKGYTLHRPPIPKPWYDTQEYGWIVLSNGHVGRYKVMYPFFMACLRQGNAFATEEEAIKERDKRANKVSNKLKE